MSQPQIIFRVSEDELTKISADAAGMGLPANQFAKEVMLHLRHGKHITLKPDLELIKNYYERQLLELRAQLSEAQKVGELAGIQQNEKTVEQRLQEILDKRDFEQLKRDHEGLQRQLASVERELETAEETIAEQTKQFGYVEIASKVGPGLLNGLMQSLPPKTRERIGNGLAGLLMGTPEGSAPEALGALSEEDQQHLEFSRSITDAFSERERQQLVELIYLLSQNKPMLVKLLTALHQSIKPSPVAVP